MLADEQRTLTGARVLVVGVSYKSGVADCREAPAIEIIRLLCREGAEVEFHDPLVASVSVDGRLHEGVDPDPRRDRSGFGPEDYDLAVVVTVHPGYDYGWLHRVPAVLDCTYRTAGGHRRQVP
jgi:UDP-N-acetyl-D-mannosaminuronate dehydrogenase